jgi:hypothetical protein
MPLKSLITFSSGQNPPNDNNETAVQGRIDLPIFSFGTLAPVGALQESPLVATLAAEKQTDPVPTGAQMMPSVEFNRSGRFYKLKTRQLWEGTVVETMKDGFVAVLSDKTNPNNPDEKGRFEFDNTELSKEDRLLVRPGSSFYWIIGSEKTPGDQVQTVSRLQFRRFPVWTSGKLEQARKRAQHLSNLFQEKA